ncbi:CatB-related O-acetyltransferase [Natrarchaeobaculum sulfurireducens]|uniref:Acetyltransferase n=1 Tax=Natrarchaeobaculum sulfurireducens TaxID=2044521 RepID=A0A346PN97_9EURY|nr:CatB-related O-acetyltransferase [Natrarchaeobaculum sulfurireducens]AXR78962.1 Acetyltransferase (isoleucine patch superfamily) [Natrarchaeobaculum sulfurireducens]AXR80992.1 Acetyltransferase [Natrarchaeobaculum sulfurireducens]
MTLATVLDRTLSVLGYPRPTHGLVNRFRDETRLEVDPTARIATGCLLRGQVDLASRARLSRGCILNGDVSVGRGTNLEPECELVGDVDLGRYCAIARETVFQETNHEMAQPSLQIRLYDRVLDSDLHPASKGPITVGSDVWIGARATILSGVEIGHGAVIGAGAIVTDDVEPYAVVAGIPAERVKWRFPESVREKLLELEWWEWDERTIRANRDFFERELVGPEDVPSVDERRPTESSRESGRARAADSSRVSGYFG